MTQMSERTTVLQNNLRFEQSRLETTRGILSWTLTPGHDWYEAQHARKLIALCERHVQAAQDLLFESMVLEGLSNEFAALDPLEDVLV